MRPSKPVCLATQPKSVLSPRTKKKKEKRRRNCKRDFTSFTGEIGLKIGGKKSLQPYILPTLHISSPSKISI
jgi:hypothetical protein